MLCGGSLIIFKRSFNTDVNTSPRLKTYSTIVLAARLAVFSCKLVIVRAQLNIFSNTSAVFITSRNIVHGAQITTVGGTFVILRSQSHVLINTSALFKTPSVMILPIRTILKRCSFIMLGRTMQVD
jgi:hypothetical protein